MINYCFRVIGSSQHIYNILCFYLSEVYIEILRYKEITWHDGGGGTSVLKR